MGRVARWALSGGVVLALGCSRSQATGEGTADAGSSTVVQRIASCDRIAQSGTCSEYGGAYLAQNEGLLTASCAKLGGTFLFAECPNTSDVGTCRLSTGELRKFYGTGSAAFDDERAKKECTTTFRGTWQPHP